MSQRIVACLLWFTCNSSIAAASSREAWSIKDDISCFISPGTAMEEMARDSLVYRVYSSISRSVPHKDNFYPSCSRYIRMQFERINVAGLILGFGRFSRSHIPPVDPLFPSVIANGVVKIYDPPDFLESNGDYSLPNNGYTARPNLYNDCSESFRVISVDRDAGGLDSSWGL
ncbi:MAG: hypothetical protein R3B45_05000 [Bdellovibrionota bacterium]